MSFTPKFSLQEQRSLYTVETRVEQNLKSTLTLHVEIHYLYSFNMLVLVLLPWALTLMEYDVFIKLDYPKRSVQFTKTTNSYLLLEASCQHILLSQSTVGFILQKVFFKL